MNRPIPWLITAPLASAGTTHAATPADVCTNLAEARSQLVAMLGSTDPATLDGLKTKVHASSEVDADLGAMAGGPDAAKVAAFKPVRGGFQEDTRRRDHPRHLCRQDRRCQSPGHRH